MTGHPVGTITINAGAEVAEVNLCVILLIENVDDFFITAVNVVEGLVIIVIVIFTDVVFSNDLTWPQTCSVSVILVTPQLLTAGPTVSTIAGSVAHVWYLKTFLLVITCVVGSEISQMLACLIVCIACIVVALL